MASGIVEPGAGGSVPSWIGAAFPLPFLPPQPYVSGMLTDALREAVAALDRHAVEASPDYPPGLLAEVLRVRMEIAALRVRLESPPTCVPGCLRALIDGPGHPGRCVEPPATWPRIVR